MEKPPASSLAELSSLQRGADLASVQVAVMFQHRFCLPRVPAGRFDGAVASLVVSRPRPAGHYQEDWRGRPSIALGG